MCPFELLEKNGTYFGYTSSDWPTGTENKLQEDIPNLNELVQTEICEACYLV